MNERREDETTSKDEAELLSSIVLGKFTYSVPPLLTYAY